MLPNQNPQQHICVCCVVKNNGALLLLRSGEYMDEAHQQTAGYFRLPRFTLDFGANPEAMIEKELREQFNQEVESMTVIAVDEMILDPFNQTVELTYEVRVQGQGQEQVGRFVFLDPNELEHYTFPNELARIRRLLS